MADRLRTRGAAILSTRDILAALLNEERPSRSALIALGDELDRKMSASWIAEAIDNVRVQSPQRIVCVDRVRKPFQVIELQTRYGKSLVHAHMSANHMSLGSRHANRQSSNAEDVAFERLIEQDRCYDQELREMADLSFDTDRQSLDEMETELLRALTT